MELPARRERIDCWGHAIVVDLWESLCWPFRDEVRVYRDVGPALGGLLGSSKVRRGRGGDEFAWVCGMVRESRDSGEVTVG